MVGLEFYPKLSVTEFAAPLVNIYLFALSIQGEKNDSTNQYA